MLPVITVVLVISLGESVPKHRALRRHDSRRWAVRSARNLCSQRQQISHQRSIGGSRVGQAKGEAGLTSELLASPREVGVRGAPGQPRRRRGGVESLSAIEVVGLRSRAKLPRKRGWWGTPAPRGAGQEGASRRPPIVPARPPRASERPRGTEARCRVL